MSGSVDVTTTTAHKIATAKQNKEKGDQAFKTGNAKEGKVLPQTNWFLVKHRNSFGIVSWGILRLRKVCSIHTDQPGRRLCTCWD
jgi:hypothetical protein